MGHSKKAQLMIATSLTLGCALVIGQQLDAALQDSGADRESLNDIRRGLSIEDENRNEKIEGISPARRIRRDTMVENFPLSSNTTYRSIDGSDNNQTFKEMNSRGAQLRRWLSADYSDGISALAGQGMANPRDISNAVAAQSESKPNARGATDFLWQWGQFLDHDFSLTDGVEPAEHENITIAAGDAWFDPDSSGERELTFNRSLYDTQSGTSTDNPRQQLNEVTGWIDASNVYGSDLERADALRTLDGHGYLATSEDNLLPYNVAGLANAGGVSEQMFVAGDVRSNEQVGLTALHTLFVREHNRLINEILLENPSLSGDKAYQKAREIVSAQMQVITYQEFLPRLLGSNALPDYEGYKPELDASMVNSFSTAGYRLGHSLISPKLLLLDRDMQPIERGNLPLRDAFFSPSVIEQVGIDPILRGLATQVCQELDPYEVDDIRNFLFGAPGSNGFDLVSLNIQRGRDHGLPGYNQARIELGLEPAADFTDVTSDVELQQRLAGVYNNVDEIDLWVGSLSEDHIEDAMVGELLWTLLVHQFTVLRDGDRFWYENQLTTYQVDQLQNTSLADIIRRNTAIGDELPDDVFQIVHLQEGGKQHKRRETGRRAAEGESR